MADRLKIEPVSGFPEWLPGTRLVEDRFLAIIRQQYQLYGFTPIETPAVERLEVLTSKGGMQRQIYTVGKPEAGKSDVDLGLHFDLTVPLARYVVQYADKLVFPFRRYQIQKVWRGERAQRGRFREFYQCDVDVVGRNKLNIIHDAEIPCVINAVFEALELPSFQVQISNRKILGDLIKVKEVGPEQLVSALRAIDKTQRDGIDKTRDVLAKEGVAEPTIPAILDLIQCPNVDDARAILKRAGCATEGLDELQTVIGSAVDLGMPAERLRPNFAIARGLDYYTGTIYETFVTGKEDWGSICSGGRYDDLAGFFTSQKYPGVGISIGLTRLFNLLVENQLVDLSCQTPTKVLIAMQNRESFLTKCLNLANRIRRQGIPTEVYLEPADLRKQIVYASRKAIPLVVIAGEEELAVGNWKVKDMRQQREEQISEDRLLQYLGTKIKETSANAAELPSSK